MTISLQIFVNFPDASCVLGVWELGGIRVSRDKGLVGFEVELRIIKNSN